MIKRTSFSLIHYAFSVLIVCIAFATIVVDKNIDSAFPNTVAYPNAVYYLIAAVVFWVIVCLQKKFTHADISNKAYMVMMLTVPCVIFVFWQIPVSRWIYWFATPSDFGSIMYASMGLNNGQNFADWPYFLQSPNNANISIAMSWLYKIVPNWKGIILIGALLTNLSAVLAALSVKNITKNRYTSIVTLVLAEILMGMNWRSFLVYTDNYNMIFVALIFWAFTLEIRDGHKFFAVTFFSAIGTFIKPTALIGYLSILIFCFLNLISNEKTKILLKVKKGLSMLVVMSVVFGTMIAGQNALRSYYGLDLEGQYPKGWQYMLMVGQNDKYYGVTNSDDPQIREEYIAQAQAQNEDVSYVNNKLLEEGLSRILNRGIWGNIKFYVGKLNVAYNDGYFHNLQVYPPSASHELKQNLLYQLLWKDGGNLYRVSAGVFQTVWDMVLLSLMAGIVVFRKRDFPKVLELCILGVTLYLMLFEGRSKYLYMFLPVYLMTAGASLQYFLDIINTPKIKT